MRLYREFAIIRNVNGKWNVEFTDEFETWWSELTVAAQDDIDRVVLLLEKNGPTLGYPYSSDIKGAKIRLRELRIQHKGHPLRVLYAFDPVRSALLLLGGDKTGRDDWYEKNVPIAERLFADHLVELEKEKENGNERTL